MQQPKCILDTNILIRYLTNDTPAQTKAIETIFKNAKDKSLMIPDVVVIEIVHVLLSFYQMNKEDIIEKISILVSFEKFKVNTRLFQRVIEMYAQHPISFVDAYLLVLTTSDEKTVLYTFDRKLIAIDQTRVKQP